jgi:hypothetical protein
MLEDKYGKSLRNHPFVITSKLTRADFPFLVEDIHEGTIVQYYSDER